MDADKEEKRPPRVTGRRAAIAIAVVLAVACVVYLGRDAGAPPALPEYALEVDGGASGRLEVRTGSDFELVLRPAPAAHPPEKVVAYVFAVGEGEPNAVDAKVAVDPVGLVRIAGRARTLAGARELRVVLGSASEFKRYEDALSRALDGRSDGSVRVLVVPIVHARGTGP